MVFDFAARPPEVNSTLMYSGAGAGPMTAAASTFGTLSSELSTNAAAYESIISAARLGVDRYLVHLDAASAQQNIEWLNTTSVQLQEAAAKATASAAAYEAAFSATIPPPVVTPTGLSWRRSSQPTSWDRTPPPSPPTRRCTASSGRRTPPR